MAPRGYNKHFLVVGAGHNKKFVGFSDGERCAHFLGVCALAAQSPVRGYLLLTEDEEITAANVASEASVSLKIARSAMEKLKKRGVLKWDEDLGAWFIHDWDEVNPPPKTDTTAAERQRRRRAKVKAQTESHAKVTHLSRRDNRDGHAPVTTLSRGEVEGEVEETPTTYLPSGSEVVAS